MVRLVRLPPSHSPTRVRRVHGFAVRLITNGPVVRVFASLYLVVLVFTSLDALANFIFVVVSFGSIGTGPPQATAQSQTLDHEPAGRVSVCEPGGITAGPKLGAFFGNAGEVM